MPLRLAVVGALATVTMLALAGSAEATFAGRTGGLAMSAAVRPGDLGFGPWVVWQLNLRTRSTRQLTRVAPECESDDPWYDQVADYSPDGRRILYVHSDGCAGAAERSGIWLIAAHGGTPRKVASLPMLGPRSALAMYLPDGARAAALWREPISGSQVLTIFNIATGALEHQTQMPFGHPQDGGDWGSRARLALTKPWGREALQRIHSVVPDGSSARRLTAPRPGEGRRSLRWSWDTHPDWSPSGRSIAFLRTTQSGVDASSARQGGAHRAQASYSYDIWRVRAVGPPRPAQPLTRLRAAGPPVFSPEGRMIAFPGPRGIYTVPSRGGQVRRLVRIRRAFSEIAWRPLPGVSR